jgi:N-ethylmaleimide reductase
LKQIQTNMEKLFEPFRSAHLELSNRIAMAPMTRSRAIGNVPNEMMAEYYALRADAGLIITEGTSPSKNGLGYPNIPGVYSAEQINGWKRVTDAVHAKGGKIFLQVMHTGRVGHPLNMPEGGELVAPSAIAAAGLMFTLQEGMQPHPTPRAMTLEDIQQAQDEYVQAAKNAVEAGFDGVEIHAANGYLPNQFINATTNQREDSYGGSVENRARFVLEVTQKMVEAIGSDKTGIRLSPYVQFNDLGRYDSIADTYTFIVDQLNKMDLAYLHLLDVRAMGAQDVPDGFLLELVRGYQGVVMFNGGLGADLNEATKLVELSDRYLISLGSLFIANPDLIKRLKMGAKLNEFDQSTLYTPGREGYLTYPTLD